MNKPRGAERLSILYISLHVYKSMYMTLKEQYKQVFSGCGTESFTHLKIARALQTFFCVMCEMSPGELSQFKYLTAPPQRGEGKLISCINNILSPLKPQSMLPRCVIKVNFGSFICWKMVLWEYYCWVTTVQMRLKSDAFPPCLVI